jgi:polyhydroxyalkanoate synthesis regulator phasin
MALAIDGKLSQKEAGLFARDLHSMSREASTDRGTADTLSMMADKIGKHGMKAGTLKKASPPAAAVREMEPTNSMKRVPPKPKKPDTVVPSGSRALRDKELQSRVDSMVDEMHRSGTKLRVADVEKFADELEDKALGLMESKNERLADEAEKMIATSELLRKTAWDLLE